MRWHPAGMRNVGVSDPPVVFAGLDHRQIAFILPGYELNDVALAWPAARKHGIVLGRVLIPQAAENVTFALE